MRFEDTLNQDQKDKLEKDYETYWRMELFGEILDYIIANWDNKGHASTAFGLCQCYIEEYGNNEFWNDLLIMILKGLDYDYKGHDMHNSIKGWYSRMAS